MTLLNYIKQQTQLPEKVIENTLFLLNQGCTIPFIARYRKDKTQNLDEISIENILKKNIDYQNICKRQQNIIDAINKQNKLTSEIKIKINNTFNINELEDIYLPFKKQRKTKADIAKEKGFEPLAKMIMSQKYFDLNEIISIFLNKTAIHNEKEALQGASDIIAEWINENIFIRNGVRNFFRKTAQISSQVVSKVEHLTQAQKYKIYYNHSELLLKAPSHRILALLRAEKEGFIKIKIDVPIENILSFIEKTIIKNPNTKIADFLKNTIKDSYKRLLEPSISNEILQEVKEKSDDKAIDFFSENLTQLLLAPPLTEQQILAIDPGFKTGCKVVCLNKQGDFLNYTTIFPHNGKEIDAENQLKKLIQQFDIQAIAIGNGTASRETENFIKHIKFDKNIPIFIVNEAGASVYSASKVAREEFPNFDITIRGAISIGRRLADPLAELVKIDPKSIGVGQYQHDVNQKKLKQELDNVVIRCVNKVGINLNTASKYLLSYVSGIGEKMAENIVNYRNQNGAFKTRETLKNIPRFSEKTYQQSVGFFRIYQGEHPLDNSAIHPEAYTIVEQMAKDLSISVKKLIGNKELISKIDIKNYTNEHIGLLYLNDLLKELEKPGIDPRIENTPFEFDNNIQSINDLKIGMILPGIINNITAFGCFVSLGIKENGLVHISNIKEGFTSNIKEVIKLNQKVNVKIINIDYNLKRIDLTMIF